MHFSLETFSSSQDDEGLRQTPGEDDVFTNPPNIPSERKTRFSITDAAKNVMGMNAKNMTGMNTRNVTGLNTMDVKTEIIRDPNQFNNLERQVRCSSPCL